MSKTWNSLKRRQRPSPSLALACLQAPSAAAFAEGSFQRTLQVTGPVNLEVNTGSGNIEIRTGAVQPGPESSEPSKRTSNGSAETTAQERVRRHGGEPSHIAER